MPSDDLKLPLFEEVAHVAKQLIPTEKVTIRTAIDMTAERLEASLTIQSVNVERHAVNRQVDLSPPIRIEGNVTIIPIVEERLVVEKRLFVVEEIRVVRSEAIEAVDIPVELRKQRAIVEHEELEHKAVNQEDLG